MSTTVSGCGTVTGYVNGCRCDDCRSVKVVLDGKARARATRRAARMFRLDRPGEWQRLLDEEFAAVGLNRNPVGAPGKADGNWWSTRW